MQMINDAGGACNYVLPFAFGDPIIENLCCESLSNFNPSDMWRVETVFKIVMACGLITRQLMNSLGMVNVMISWCRNVKL